MLYIQIDNFEIRQCVEFKVINIEGYWYIEFTFFDGIKRLASKSESKEPVLTKFNDIKNRLLRNSNVIIDLAS